MFSFFTVTVPNRRMIGDVSLYGSMVVRRHQHAGHQRRLQLQLQSRATNKLSSSLTTSSIHASNTISVSLITVYLTSSAEVQQTSRPDTSSVLNTSSPSITNGSPPTTSTSLQQALTVGSQSPSQSTASVKTATCNCVSPVAFYAFGGGIVCIVVLVAAILLWYWHRKRRRGVSKHENTARVRTLDQNVPRLLVEEPIPMPILNIPRTNLNKPLPLPEFPEPSRFNESTADLLPRSPLEEKMHRANLRRLAALREASLKDAVLRQHEAHSNHEDEDERAAKVIDNPFALDDDISHSDDSHWDLLRRGPSVNPAYQAARDLRYRQKIAEGYTHERAMSISEASSDDSDDPGPLFAARSTRPNASSPRPLIPTGLSQPQQAKIRTQLAPLKIPERWQPRKVEDISKTTGYLNMDFGADEQVRIPPPEEVCLREPAAVKPLRRDSSRLSQVHLAWTETDTEQTATRASTVISDDPWRDQVLENRRLGKLHMENLNNGKVDARDDRIG